MAFVGEVFDGRICWGMDICKTGPTMESGSDHGRSVRLSNRFRRNDVKSHVAVSLGHPHIRMSASACAIGGQWSAVADLDEAGD